jgi:adenosylcobinamide-GDP ribazoletransferase
VAFLTVVGGAAAPSPAAVPWFPLVGAAIGLAVGGAWWGAAQAWPRPVAAAIAVGVDLGLTGLLHLDGLCDSADGLLAQLPRERRLEVMRSPDVGAFGATVAAFALLARWAALAALAPAPLLVAGLWAASRTGMAATMAWAPYARASGLASSFAPGRGARVAVAVGVPLSLALATAWWAGPGAAAVAAAVVAGSLVVWMAWRRLGGYTGDVLGAAGVIGETVGLLVAAARW